MKIEQEIIDYAATSNDEICGYVVFNKGNELFIPCKNISADPANSFLFSSDDVIAAHKYDGVIAVVHSHPSASHCKELTFSDRRSQYFSNLDYWLCVDGIIKKYPSVKPLLRRQFEEGVSDCYSIMRDFYLLCGVNLPEHKEVAEFKPGIEWWKNPELKSPFIENMERNDFFKVKLNDIEPGDIILTKLGSLSANHVMVYVGNNEVFHHLPDRLSGCELLRDFFLKTKDSIWRHKYADEITIEQVIKMIRGK